MPLFRIQGDRVEALKSTNFDKERDLQRLVEANLDTFYESLRERVPSMSDSVEEAPKKLYVAYEVTKNFLCVETRRHKIIMYLKLNPEELKPLPPNARDVREIGHFGTGDLELTVRTEEDLDAAMPLIAQALDAIGE